MESRHLVLGDYPGLEHSLQATVQGFREEHPLEGIALVAPSNLLTSHLRQSLVASGVTLFNVRFLTLLDLARKLGEAHLRAQGKQWFFPGAIEPVLRTLLSRLEKNNPLVPVGGAGVGFLRAARETLVDLKEALVSPADVARSARAARGVTRRKREKLRAIARLYEDYQSFLDRCGLYDAADLFRAAAEQAARSPFWKEVRLFLLYGFYDLNALQRHLLAACWDQCPAQIFFPWAPEEVRAFSEPLRRWFSGEGFVQREAASRPPHPSTLSFLRSHLFSAATAIKSRPASTQDGSVEIFSAVGEVMEADAIARDLAHLQRETGLAPEQMGVLLLPGSRPYKPLLKATLERVGLPVRLPQGIPLSDTPAGRSMILLLEVQRSEFRRPLVVEFLSYAPLKPFHLEGCGRAPAALWDTLSRKAGIVSGAAQWSSRLDSLRRRLAQKAAEREEAAIDEPTYADERIRALQKLMDLIDRLAPLESSIPHRGSWSDLLEPLLRIYRSLVEESNETNRVVDEVTRLTTLDHYGVEADRAACRSAIESILARSTAASGSERGVTVSGLMEARGVPFSVVALPGLADGVFPSLPRQDPLLLDDEREVINRRLALSARPEGMGLPLKLARHEEERLLFWHAWSAARTRLLLSYPRSHMASSRPTMPSPFLLSLTSLLGKPAIPQELEGLPFHSKLPLDWEPAAALSSQEPPLTARMRSADLEVRVSQREREIHRSSKETLAAVMEMVRSRWEERRLTRFDGLLSQGAWEGRRGDSEEAPPILSASEIETYNRCPLQYLFRHKLRLEPLEEPERQATITPLDRGTLAHRALWRFYTELRRSGMLPIQQGNREALCEHLRVVLHETFKHFQQTGAIGYSLDWDVRKKELMDDLCRFLELDMNRSEGLIPSHFEVRFGTGKQEEEEDPLSCSEGVPFSLPDGSIVYFRGKIDRIDLSADGRRMRVIDYKTGSSKSWARVKTGFDRGRALQLAIYLIAAEHLLRGRAGEASRQEACYVSVGREGDFKVVPFTWGKGSEKHDAFRRIVEHASRGIATGEFFPHPAGNACHMCNYKHLCGAEVSQLYRRKIDDPAIAAFLELREISA